MSWAELFMHCNHVVFGGKSCELLNQAVSAPLLVRPIHLNQREAAVEQWVFGSAMTLFSMTKNIA